MQSWEGPLTVTTTIKGRTPSARGGGRNRERLPRGEEDLSKGPRTPVLLGSAPAIQVHRLVLTDSSADLEATGAARIANDSDGGDETSSSSLETASDAYGGDYPGKATEVPVATEF